MVKHTMKKMMICAMLIAGVQVPCMAEDMTATAKPTVAKTEATKNAAFWLEPAEGNWYSVKGNLVMTVQGSTINGCAVAEEKDCTYEYPRQGQFQIVEAEGPRSMKLELLGHKSHQYLIVDNTMPLRRSVHPEYNESIGGIYIGMTKTELEDLYQQPTMIREDQGMERLTYGNQRIDVYLRSGIVMAVRMYKGSSLTFDKSGLTAEAAADTYKQTYSLETLPAIPGDTSTISPAYKLAQGEYLRFGKNFVQLDIM